MDWGYSDLRIPERHITHNYHLLAVCPDYFACINHDMQGYPSTVETLGSFRTLESIVLDALITLANIALPTYNPTTGLPSNDDANSGWADDFTDMFTEL